MPDKYSKRNLFWTRRKVKQFLCVIMAVVVIKVCHFAITNSPSAPSRDVITLTDGNFADLVESGGKVWLVEFYAPWCPHCLDFANQYVEVAKRLKGKVNVGAVDAVANKELKRRFNINSFPTFKIFIRTSSQSEPIQYRGQRTVDAMVQAALTAAGGLY